MRHNMGAPAPPLAENNTAEEKNGKMELTIVMAYHLQTHVIVGRQGVLTCEGHMPSLV